MSDSNLSTPRQKSDEGKKRSATKGGWTPPPSFAPPYYPDETPPEQQQATEAKRASEPRPNANSEQQLQKQYSRSRGLADLDGDDRFLLQRTPNVRSNRKLATAIKISNPGLVEFTPPHSPQSPSEPPFVPREVSIGGGGSSSGELRPPDITLDGSLNSKPTSPSATKTPVRAGRRRRNTAESESNEDYDDFDVNSLPLPSQTLESSPDAPTKRAEKVQLMRSLTPKPLLSRKTSLIENKEKLETRWQWNQQLVSKTFAPYRRMICELDDLLPDPDELDSFRDDDDDNDTDDDKDEWGVVRSAMLENLALTEREIASFFEGFTLFKTKLRSMEAQLNAAKMAAMSRTTSMYTSIRSVAGKGMGDVHVGDNIKSGLQQAILQSTQGSKSESSPSTAPLQVKSSVPQQSGKSSRTLRSMSILKVQQNPGTNDEVKKLLQALEEADRQRKKLEKQLQQAGVVIAEDIPYEIAKAKVESIAKRMNEIGGSDVTRSDPEEQKKLREEYFKLEQDMEKYNAALVLTDEWLEEQKRLEQKWEDDNAPGNLEALIKLRRHMPVNVRQLSEEALCTTPTPNGRYLPRDMAKKFKRTNVLQLLRLNPEDILRMHPSTLENMRVVGLTLTERRALYAHLKDIGPRWMSMQSDKTTERKWVWYNVMKLNFKENLEIYLRHVEKYGPPGNHPYATRDNPSAGCPLIGKQCPLKADKILDYDGDYGFTPDAEYEVSEVRKSGAEVSDGKNDALELIRNKKAGERSDSLKKHYKSNVLQVSQAEGSCEAMDAFLDSLEGYRQRWSEEWLAIGSNITEETSRKEMTSFREALNEVKLAVLQFADRSGMQLTGKRDANADNPDRRSPVELGLCEEVCEMAELVFTGIDERMMKIKVKDGRIKSSIEQMRDLLEELHERNMATLAKLECVRPNKSRKIKTWQDIMSELKKKSATSSGEAGGEQEARPRDVVRAGGGGGGGGRGILDAINAARGGGDFLSAVRAKGRGRGDLNAALRGIGDEVGEQRRGDLSSAIAGRGRGDETGGRGGGRGDFLSAIAGRGRGGDSGGRGGGRGDLLSAIAGRGRGGDSGGRGGGRGDLLSAIAARAERGRGGGNS